MQCRHGAGCHMRLGDGCHCVKVCRTNRTTFFSVGVCISSVDCVMHVCFTVLFKRMLIGRVVVIKCTLKKKINVEPSCSISRPYPIKIYITCPYKRNLSLKIK